MSKTFRYLWLSGLSSLMTVAACVLIRPTVVSGHYGLSYYGNFRATVIPYGIGLTLTAYFLLRASWTLRGMQVIQSFRPGLEWVGIALLGIVATPSLSSVWVIQNLHLLFGLIIFLIHAMMSLHYLLHTRTDKLGWSLLAIQVVAISLVLLSFPSISITHFMLPAQVAAIGSFGTLLLRAIAPK